MLLWVYEDNFFDESCINDWRTQYTVFWADDECDNGYVYVGF